MERMLGIDVGLERTVRIELGLERTIGIEVGSELGLGLGLGPGLGPGLCLGLGLGLGRLGSCDKVHPIHQAMQSRTQPQSWTFLGAREGPDDARQLMARAMAR